MYNQNVEPIDELIQDDKDMVCVSEAMLEEALEDTLEPIMMNLLSQAYKNVNAEHNLVHALPEDCFICTVEDNVRTLGTQD